MPAAKSDRTLERLRKICLALPDTKETLIWGHPHFRVGEKIFCGYGHEDGKASIGFKVTMDDQDALIMRDGFRIAKYVGRYGWVTMDLTQSADWGEVEDLVHESYELIAPKTSLAKIGAATAPDSHLPKASDSPWVRLLNTNSPAADFTFRLSWASR
jgi:predicted DNA-binding protein (MmcQ/YjbR family)